MNGIDLAFGFLAGVVSCLTPQTLLLFPLVPAAIGAKTRSGVVALALGLGLSLVLTGIGAPGLEAVWLRRIVCALLFLLGIVLSSPSLVERYPSVTGGLGNPFQAPAAATVQGAFRLLVLGLFVGANWIPLLGPSLGKATLMAADGWDLGQAAAILLMFGMGAAVPWIVAGRILRLGLRPFMGSLIEGMGGKRVLGLTLLIVAVLGATGLDGVLAAKLDPLLPPWTSKMAATF